MSTGEPVVAIDLVPTLQRLVKLVTFEGAVARLQNAKDPLERRAYAMELDALVKEQAR